MEVFDVDGLEEFKRANLYMRTTFSTFICMPEVTQCGTARTESTTSKVSINSLTDLCLVA